MGLTVSFNLKLARCKDLCLVPFYKNANDLSGYCIISHHLLKLNLELTITACLPHNLFDDLGL